MLPKLLPVITLFIVKNECKSQIASNSTQRQSPIILLKQLLERKRVRVTTALIVTLKL